MRRLLSAGCEEGVSEETLLKGEEDEEEPEEERSGLFSRFCLPHFLLCLFNILFLYS